MDIRRGRLDHCRGCEAAPEMARLTPAMKNSSWKVHRRFTAMLRWADVEELPRPANHSI
jgi:hypothetical protein